MIDDDNLSTSAATTDDVRRRYEQPALTAMQIAHIFRSIERISERLDERAQNERLIVASFDRFAAGVGRLTAAVSHLDLCSGERATGVHAVLVALERRVAAVEGGLGPVGELVAVVRDDLLASDVYATQAIETLGRHTDAIYSLPRILRTVIELTLSDPTPTNGEARAVGATTTIRARHGLGAAAD